MRFCGACGAPLAEAPAPWEGDANHAQRRHMTVMLCDVVDSTPLAESLDPEDFREVLRGYQDACARAIERFKGHAAQYVGDGVVAYFGYPRAHEDDAQRAVHAALGILDEVAMLNERLGELLDVSLQVRVGLHTGVVVAGEMGAGQTREPLAIVGETPHIAARLQTLAPPGTVVMTDATRDLVADDFETEALGMKALKGISRPIGVHLVLRPAGRLDRGQRVGRPHRPMIDRTLELVSLGEAWEHAKRGQGVVVHIAGEAGIGKSRLVQAFREDVAGEAQAEHVLQCSAHHSRTALYPAIRFLNQMMSLDSRQASEGRLEAVEDAVVGAGLDPAATTPLLADLLSINGGDSERITLMPRDARNATLQILEALLVGEAARHPLLFVLEDLHWADPTTVELLERIVANLAGMPVACILTFRSEFEPPWAQSQPALKIHLGPLASEDVRAMASTAGLATLDRDTLTRVESAADGVPLFVEEMVKMLAAGIQPGAPAHRRSESVVPSTLQGLLAERLDRLPELTEVIDIAAVLGREFESVLLDAVSPLDSSDLSSAVDQLASEEILRPVEGSGSRLEFTHALLQEAAYERLVRRRRSSLHGRVAEALAARQPSAGESEPELIAHHWSCAGRPAEAVPYWHLAGARALKRAAFQEAAEQYRCAIESLDAARPGMVGDPERGDFLTHLGVALQAGRSPAADVDATYGAARSAFERTGQPRRLIPVIRGQWMFHLTRAEYPAALECANEMLAMGEQGGPPVCWAEGSHYRGLARMYTGDLDGARADLEEAVRRHQPPERRDDIYLAQGDTGVAALAYLAMVQWNQGYVQKALARSDWSLALADQVRSPVTFAQAWGMRCGLLLTQGRLAELIPWLEQTRIHSTERNIGYWRTVCSIWSAWMRGRAGEPELGTALLRENLDAYLESGGRLAVPHFQILLAQLRLAAGDRAGALEALRAGQEQLDATGERMSEPELNWFLGRVFMAGDSPEPVAATAAYERAMLSAREQNAKLLELRAATHLALHQREVGEARTALARVESLCSWFGPESETPDVARARALLGEEARLR
jgi:class 3 adenylate cyclase/tetratricopeptide (TPR) repeat protein